MMRKLVFLLVLTATLAGGGHARGDLKSKAAREAAEYVFRKFGKEGGEEGVRSLTRRLEALVTRHGDDALVAVRKSGPVALHLAEEAGPHAGPVVKLLARHGDDAVWVVSHPRRLRLFVEYGDSAAEAMMRHRGVAEPLIEAFELPAVRALNSVSSKNGRRLTTMLEDGELTKLSQPRAVLDVIGRYGDRAMEFVWKHKGALATAAVLAAFLADPEPFLEGVKDITAIAAEKAVQPLAEVPGKVAEEAARQINWTLVVVVGVGLGALVILVRKTATPRGLGECKAQQRMRNGERIESPHCSN